MKSKEIDVLKIKKFSLELRKNILEMAFSAGASSSHLGGALSIVEIVATLFSYKMKINNFATVAQSIVMTFSILFISIITYLIIVG